MKKIFLIACIAFMPCIAEESVETMKKILTGMDSKDIGLDGVTGQYYYDEKLRENGDDWPLTALTMIGLKRLNNVQFCVEDVIKNNIPGDFLETGIWRGGVCIFARYLFKIHGVTDRTVWGADSFQGLPAPNSSLYPKDHNIDLSGIDFLKVSLEQVKQNFASFNLLDNQVKFIEGWFKDSLPGAPVEKISVLRLDGDLYESTIQALESLYPKVSEGGYIIIDDYHLREIDLAPAYFAVHDFRNKYGISDPIIAIDAQGVYWKKTTPKRSIATKEPEAKILPWVDPVAALLFVKDYLPENPIILEAGAFDGEDTVKMSNLWPQGFIYSFEPVPQLFQIFKEKTKNSSNVLGYPVALSDQNGSALFYPSKVGDELGGSGSLLQPKDHVTLEPDIIFDHTIEVPTITLDTWLSQYNGRPVDFLWLDMQGFEMLALKSGMTVLKDVKLIFLEVEFREAYSKQPLYDEVKNWLEDQGFMLIAKDFEVPFEMEFINNKPKWFGNAVFIRKNYYNTLKH